MYRFLIFLFVCFLFVPDSFGSLTVTNQRPHHNPYSNPYFYRDYYNNPRGYYSYNRYHRKNVSELNALEKYALNKTYKDESEFERLQRLELQAFGAIQQGDFDTRYDRVRSAILSRPKAHTNSSVWRSIGDYFSGQMTGFTPSFNQYGGYLEPSSSGYGNSSFTQYFNPFGTNGYNTGNRGTLSGMGITILD